MHNGAHAHTLLWLLLSTVIDEGQSCRNLKWDLTWQIIEFTKSDFTSQLILE